MSKVIQYKHSGKSGTWNNWVDRQVYKLLCMVAKGSEQAEQAEAYRAQVNEAREARVLGILGHLSLFEQEAQTLQAMEKEIAKPGKQEDAKDEAAIVQYLAAIKDYESLVAKRKEVKAMAQNYLSMKEIDWVTPKPQPNGYARKLYFQAMLEMEAVATRNAIPMLKPEMKAEFSKEQSAYLKGLAALAK